MEIRTRVTWLCVLLVATQAELLVAMLEIVKAEARVSTWAHTSQAQAEMLLHMLVEQARALLQTKVATDEVDHSGRNAMQLCSIKTFDCRLRSCVQSNVDATGAAALLGRTQLMGRIISTVSFLISASCL